MEKHAQKDVAREISDLLALAGWYRAWAALTVSAMERDNRLDMAEAMEKKARALGQKLD